MGSVADMWCRQGVSRSCVDAGCIAGQKLQSELPFLSYPSTSVRRREASMRPDDSCPAEHAHIYIHKNTCTIQYYTTLPSHICRYPREHKPCGPSQCTGQVYPPSHAPPVSHERFNLSPGGKLNNINTREYINMLKLTGAKRGQN